MPSFKDLGMDNFNASEQEPMQDFGLLEEGHYEAAIIKSEVKEARKEGNFYLNLSFQVLSGAGKGKRVWALLNLKNSNETAEQIARKELGAICKAIGVESVDDNSELHDIPMMIFVGIEEASNGYPEKNIIKGYAPLDGSIENVEKKVEKKAEVATEAGETTVDDDDDEAPWA